MGKFFTGFLGIILIAIGTIYYLNNKDNYEFDLANIFYPRGSITLTSSDFPEGSSIPIRLSCDGSNISPALFFDGVPKDAKSLAIIMEDIDSIPEPFTHWISYNLGPEVTKIDNAKVLGSGRAGVNDFGNIQYNGPCPPYGDTRRYVFRIYALDVELNLNLPRRAELKSAMKGHIIASGKLTGVYSRNP